MQDEPNQRVQCSELDVDLHRLQDELKTTQDRLDLCSEHCSALRTCLQSLGLLGSELFEAVLHRQRFQSVMSRYPLGGSDVTLHQASQIALVPLFGALGRRSAAHLCTCSKALSRVRSNLEERFPLTICVLGGASSAWEPEEVTVDSIECLDLASLCWGSADVPPRPPNGRLTNVSAIAAAGGSLFVVGGADNGGRVLSSVERLDVASGAWSSLPPMTTGRGGSAVLVAGGCLVVCGGDQIGLTLNSCEALDFSSMHWAALPSLQRRRRGAACAQIGDTIFVLGGDQLASADDGGDELPGEEGELRVLSSAECLPLAGGAAFFSMEGGPDPPAWMALPPMLQPRTAAAGAASGKFVFVVGGQGSADVGDLLASAERLDPASGEWALLAPMEIPRWGPVAASVRGRIYVFGGWDPVGTDLTSAECLDVSNGNWSPLPPMQAAHFRLAAAVSDSHDFAQRASQDVALPASGAWDVMPYS